MVAAAWSAWALALSVPTTNADPIDAYIATRPAEAPNMRVCRAQLPHQEAP